VLRPGRAEFLLHAVAQRGDEHLRFVVRGSLRRQGIDFAGARSPIRTLAREQQRECCAYEQFRVKLDADAHPMSVTTIRRIFTLSEQPSWLPADWIFHDC
jgi:hypothetical protein